MQNRRASARLSNFQVLLNIRAVRGELRARSKAEISRDGEFMRQAGRERARRSEVALRTYDSPNTGGQRRVRLAHLLAASAR